MLISFSVSMLFDPMICYSHGIGQTHDHEHGCHNHNHENHHDHTPHNIHDNSNFSQPGNFDSPRSTTLDASDIHNDFSTDGDDTIVYSLNVRETIYEMIFCVFFGGGTCELRSAFVYIFF